MVHFFENAKQIVSPKDKNEVKNMKKLMFIITLIIGAFLISFSPVEAVSTNEEVERTFVCLVGGNYEEYLKFDGFKEVKREVNFHQTGEYYIVYQKIGSATEITKKVVVLSRSELLNEGYYENKIDLLTSPSSLDNTPTATLSLEGDAWVIAYSILDPSNQEAGCKIVIAYGEATKIIWQKVLRFDAYGAIESLAWDNGKIIGVGTLYNDLSRNDGWLVVLDEKGSILYDQTYGGSGHDYFKMLQVTSDEYLIVGKSNSTDSIFIGEKELFDSFIISIDKESFQVKYIYNVGTPGNDELVGFLYDGGYFYAIQKTTTTSLFMQIIKVNLSGKIISTNELYLPNNLEIIKMKMNPMGKMNFMAKYYSYQYNHDLISFYELNSDLSIKELDVHKKSGDKQVRGMDFQFLESGETILYYETRTKDNVYGYQLKTKKGNETTAFIEASTGAYIPSDGMLTPVASVLLRNSKTGELAIASNNSINVNSLGKEMIQNKSESVLIYDIMINNQPVTHGNKSSINYNPDLFGSYLLKFYFETPSLTLAYYLDLYVDLVVSVKDHEIYDLNTKLIFNGEGLLNNQRITSNYVVTEPGDYILEITGRDHRKKFINFTVKELSVNKEPIYHEEESGDLEVHFELSDDDATISYQKSLSEENKIDFRDEWYLGFPILSALIVIYSIVRRRWGL